MEPNKTYVGSLNKQPVLIKAKYKNGREIKRKIVNKRVRFKTNKTTFPENQFDTTSIWLDYFSKKL